MPRIVLTLLASALLSSGCVHHRAVLPDPTVVHRVAEEAEIKIWVRAPGGELVKTPARLLPGWYVAGPPVVDAEPSP